MTIARQRIPAGLSRDGRDRLPERSRAGGCLYDAGVSGEAVTLPDDRENPPYQSLRRGQQQIAPASRACPRPRDSAAMPLASMNSSPARSTMIRGSRAAGIYQGGRHCLGVRNVEFPT